MMYVARASSLRNGESEKRRTTKRGVRTIRRIVTEFGMDISSCSRPALRGFLLLALLDTGRAHAHTVGPAVDLGANAVQIWQPAAPRFVVGVADVVPADGALSADLTYLRHNFLKV